MPSISETTCRTERRTLHVECLWKPEHALLFFQDYWWMSVIADCSECQCMSLGKAVDCILRENAEQYSI